MGTACVGEKQNAYRISVGTPEGRRPLGRPRHKWKDKTNIDLTETGWSGMDWIHLAQDRDQWRALVYTVMQLFTSRVIGDFAPWSQLGLES
jgi:hypothetical protein